MDSTLRILTEISKHKGAVTLTELAAALNVDKQFLYARLKRMTGDVMVFHGVEPRIMLSPSGWSTVNAAQKDQAGY